MIEIKYKDIKLPEHATVEMCKRNRSMEHNCEIVDMNKFRITKPIVFCFSGNGCIDLKNANGFAKHVENYLDLLFKDKDGKRASDEIDVVSFKYARPNERRETGSLTEIAVEQISNMLLGILVDDSGNRLPLDIAKKNMSMVTFFTYCKGSVELESVIDRLDIELEKIGYSQEEISDIHNASMHISFAPWVFNRNSIPSVRFVSTRDNIVGENLETLISNEEMSDLEGVQICREKAGTLYGVKAGMSTADNIHVISGNFVNSTNKIFDEHNFHFVSRNADWEINEYEQDGEYYSGDNGDCVSQMIAWTLCKKLENSLENFNSNEYIPHNFDDDLVDELKSIRSSFSKEQLQTNFKYKCIERRKAFNDLRVARMLQMAREMDDFVPPASMVYKELSDARNFDKVFTLCEKFNYCYVEDILKGKEFLTPDQRLVLDTAMARQERIREIAQDMKLSFSEIMELFKSATSFEELKKLANRFGVAYTSDILPALISLPESEKKYNITNEEVSEIVCELKAKEKHMNGDEEYAYISEKLRALQGEDRNFENIINILEEYDYRGASDLMPVMADALSYHQIGLIRTVSKLKRQAIVEKQDFLTFPIYEKMLDKINNANSVGEIVDYLKKYDFVGVEYLMPEIMVLTESEKDEILKMAGKERIDYAPSRIFE